MVFEFRFPDVGEGITEGEIVEWKVKVGEEVKQDQVLVLVETDKAVVEIPSPREGTVAVIYKREGETIKVGEKLVSIAEKGEKVFVKKTEAGAAAKKKNGRKDAGGVVGEIKEGTRVLPPSTEANKIRREENGKKVLAMLKVRSLAKELGVDLEKIQGSGPEGAITEEDIRLQSEHKTEKAPVEKSPKISFDSQGRVLVIPLSATRKKIAEKMHESVTSIPHAVEMVEADVTELAKIREEKKAVAENKGFKLTFLPFIVRAVVVALKKNPYLNSYFDSENEQIIAKQYYNIGIAVDTAYGLMVPVIKSADSKSIMEIASDISKLAEQARTRTIKLEDLKGGTFTITNYGSIGGTFGVAIINPGEAAILGVGRVSDKPVAAKQAGMFRDANQVVVRKMMPLSLSFDHRIVDGAQTANFMVDLVKHLEDPNLLLVDLD